MSHMEKQMSFKVISIAKRIATIYVPLLLVALLQVTISASQAVAATTNGDIAFASLQNGTDWEIYAMNANGGNWRNLTNDPGSDKSPTYSPDGKKIAFVSNRDGDSEIYVMNADGSNPTNVTGNSARDSGPTFSPDGNTIAFISDRHDPNGEIYTIPATGGLTKRWTINASIDAAPAYSPLGDRIVFISDLNDPNGDIFNVNLNITAVVSPFFGVPGEKESTPEFSRDGSRVAYAAKRGGNTDVYTIAADGTGPEVRLTTDSAVDTAPAYSPDGKKIAFVSQRDIGNNREIYVMDANGDNEQNISNSALKDVTPTWQPVVVPDSSDPVPPTPTPAALPNTSPASKASNPASYAYRKACNLRISGLSLKKAKRRYTKTKEIVTRKVSRKTVRKYVTGHGFKGVIRYGSVNGKTVEKCKSVRMLVLQRKSGRLYIPGTKIRVSGKRLRRDAFAKKAVSYLKKRKIGRLRLKSRSREARFSYKNFNSKLKLGRKSFKSLRRAKYRGTFSLFYVTKVNGKTIQKEIRLKTKK